MKPTIHDVARLAGVSISTVSRVVNNTAPVSPEIYDRVLEAIKTLGYQPDVKAQKKAKKSNKLIGVMIPDISNNIFGRILRGIESVVAPKEYSIIVCDTAGELKKELHYFNLLKQKQVDGIIMSNALVTDEHLMWIKRNKFPIVFVCQDPEPPAMYDYPFGVVNINNRQAVRDMACFLYRMGHRSIAFLSGPVFDPSAGRKRLEGYMLGLEECHLPYIDALVKHAEDFTVECGYTAMKRLYEECESLPTAVLCACDNIAVGAIEFLLDNGVQVPQQISVTGIDDTSLASSFRPAITSLRHATFEQGAKAAEMLFEFIQNDIEDTIVYRMPYKILRRQSVRQLQPDK